MEPFEIRWRSSTRKDIRNLPRHEIPRIIDAVSELATDPFPHGAQKLAGADHTYRIRIGDYRVIYEVSNSPRFVEVQRVRHRKDAYRE